LARSLTLYLVGKIIQHRTIPGRRNSVLSIFSPYRISTSSKPLPGVSSNVAMKAYPNAYFANLWKTFRKFKLVTPQCPKG